MASDRVLRLALQPGLREHPVPLDRSRRNPNRGGSLLDRQPSEEAALDDPTLARADALSRFNASSIATRRSACLSLTAIRRRLLQVAQRYGANTAAPLSLSVASVVADDVSNRGRGEREELRARLKVDLPCLTSLR